MTPMSVKLPAGHWEGIAMSPSSMSSPGAPKPSVSRAPARREMLGWGRCYPHPGGSLEVLKVDMPWAKQCMLFHIRYFGKKIRKVFQVIRQDEW